MISQSNNMNLKLPHLRRDLLICLLIITVSLMSYWGVRNHEFVDFDDELIFLNPYIQSGLTEKGVKWSVSPSVSDGKYWKPLTWLTHMLVFDLYGSDPGMHLAINLILHILSAILLFVVLRVISKTTWRSAFAAILFAIHPLNVESVAWITQRHNVLSTFFWMLTVFAYYYYSNKPKWDRYLWVLISLGLGLMAKPMLITLPFVLLLLDYWPLRRIESIKKEVPKKQIMYLVLEKIPLMTLVFFSIYLSFMRIGKSFVPVESIPLTLRMKNALVSYIAYIWKMIWPFDLSVYYPYPEAIPAYKWLGAGGLIFFLSFLFIRKIEDKPYLAVGWLWYIGTLVPVIGIVQAGLQPEIADRNAYIPFIGLFIIIAWGIHDVFWGWRWRDRLLKTSAAILLGCFIMITRQQVAYWSNSISLFSHAIKVTKNNFMAHNNLGFALAEKGRIEEALAHYRKALKIFPDFELAHLNLGVVLANSGRDIEAVKHYQAAIKIRSGLVVAHNNLGNIRLRQGDFTAALKHYSDALSIDPDYVEALNGMGAVMVRLGSLDKAITYFKRAIQLQPGFKQAERNLQNVMDYKRKAGKQ